MFEIEIVHAQPTEFTGGQPAFRRQPVERAVRRRPSHMLLSRDASRFAGTSGSRVLFKIPERPFIGIDCRQQVFFRD
jgi:hypothetical protein